MEASVFIAKVLGPLFVVMGAGLLTNPAGFRAIGKEFLKSDALIYIAGFMALVMGLLIVASHNIWVAGWPVIITVFGWISLAAGIARMLFADNIRKTGNKLMKNTNFMLAAGIFYAAAGAALTWFGWLAQPR